MTIEQIVDEILRREGSEYTNRPSDRGGPTKFGITLPAFSDFLGRPATVAELKALDESTARVIYAARYVKRPGFDQIANPKLRELLVDYGVNSGPGLAARALQIAVGAKPDGVIGPETLKRLALQSEAGEFPAIYASVMRHRLRNYVGAILNDPKVDAFRRRNRDTNLENMRGWFNRFGEFL